MTKEKWLEFLKDYLPCLEAAQEAVRKHGVGDCLNVATGENYVSVSYAGGESEGIYTCYSFDDDLFEVGTTRDIFPYEKLPRTRKKGDKNNGSTKENPERQTPEAAAAEPDAGGGA